MHPSAQVGAFPSGYEECAASDFWCHPVGMALASIGGTWLDEKALVEHEILRLKI